MLSEFLGRVSGGSCEFRPTYTPRSVPNCLGNRAIHLRHRTVVLSCFFFRRADPSPLGAEGDLSIFTTPTVAQDGVTSCALFFGDLISFRLPLLRL